MAESTKQHVAKQAARMGYIVSPNAKGGRKALVPMKQTLQGQIQGLERLTLYFRQSVVQEFFGETLVELLQQGRTRGFTVDASLVEDDIKLADCLRQAADSSANALLLFTWEHLDINDGQILQQSSIPVVLINRHIEGMTYSVTLDDYAAGVQAAHYLIGLGHRHIAHLAGPVGSSSHRERTAGFRAGLQFHGCYNPELFSMPQFEYGEDQIYHWVKESLNQFLSHNPNLTAIWANNDIIAWTAIAALRSMGYQVPEDISMMGIDNLPSLRETGLTTFDFQLKELGRQAVHLLAGLFEGVINKPVRICVAPQLIPRTTTRPA